MLIHDHDPGPPDGDAPDRAPWEPNWRVWRWAVAGAVVAFAAANATGGVSVLLLLTAFGLCCRSLSEAIPYGDGLREWRQ